MQDNSLEAQADLLAEAALHELGEDPLDAADEYETQCDYAGCYPWLAEVIHAHPYVSSHPAELYCEDAIEDDSAYIC